MFLGITILGWIIIAAVYGPLLIAFALLRRRIGGARAQALVLAVLLLPLAAAVAEAVYIDWRFETLCKKAGIQITARPVVQGFFADGYYGVKGPGNLNRGPSEYRFIEWRDEQGRYWRTEKTDGAESRTVRIDEPQARYRWHFPRSATPLGHLIGIREELIVDGATGTTIAQRVNVYRYPALVDQLWWRFFDQTPTICGELRDLRSETLIGIDRQQGSR